MIAYDEIMYDPDASTSFLHKHMLVMALVIAVLAMVIGLFFTKKTFAPSTSETPTQTVNGGATSPAPSGDPLVCSSLEGPALQTCCNDWARNNNLSIMTCTGEWLLESGMCTYVCASSPTAL